MRATPFREGVSALRSEGGLLASGPTSRAFPARAWRASGCGLDGRVRWASPVTVAGPRRIRTGFPVHRPWSAAPCYTVGRAHDRQPHPHLHPPRRRRRDPPRRHEPGAQDAPADRGLRHGRRAQRAARRRARRCRTCPSATPTGCGGSRTTCSTSAPTSRSRTAATASACGVAPEQTAWLEQACDEVNADAAEPLKSFVLPGGTPAAAQLHVCRTVCRRAERRTIDCGDEVNARVRALPQPALGPAVHPLARRQRRAATSRCGSRGATAERRQGLYPAEHRALRELHAIGAPARRPLGAARRAARRRAGRALRDGAATSRELLASSPSRTAAHGLHGFPAAQGVGGWLAGAAQRRRRPRARAQPGAARSPCSTSSTSRRCSPTWPRWPTRAATTSSPPGTAAGRADCARRGRRRAPPPSRGRGPRRRDRARRAARSSAAPGTRSPTRSARWARRSTARRRRGRAQGQRASGWTCAGATRTSSHRRRRGHQLPAARDSA